MTAAAVALALMPEGPLVLGEVAEVEVTIHALETKDTRDRPLRVSVNVGTFGEVTRESAGVYKAIYRLPETRFPQVAFVAVWRETGPDAPIDFLRIPLSGRAKLKVHTRPRASVVVLVGDQSYGPAVANRSGLAVISTAVPPGTEEVIAQSTTRGETSQQTVPVSVPPYNRLTLAVTPYLVAADGRSSATVHAYYDRSEPPPIDAVAIGAPEGVLDRVSGKGGRYLFRYTPSRGTEVRTVEIGATVAGDTTSKAATSISLGTPRPAKMVISDLGETFVADGLSRTTVVALVLDRLGLAVQNLTLTATVGAGAIAGIQEVGDGKYGVTVVGPDVYPSGGVLPIQIRVGEIATTADQPIVPAPWPTSATVEHSPSVPYSDGESPVTLEIAAFDAAGRPLDGAVLTILPSHGSAGVVESLGDGRYRGSVTPEAFAERLDVVVTDETSHLSQSYSLTLRQPTKLLVIGGRVGGGLSGRQVAPTGGLELSLRPPVLDQRLGIYAGVWFTQIQERASLSAVLVEGQGGATSRLRTVPISLGLTYDVYRDQSWRVYAGAGGRVITYEYAVQSVFFDPAPERGVAFGGEILVGAEVFGFFAELAATFAELSDTHVVGPALGGVYVLGYRLGVL